MLRTILLPTAVWLVYRLLTLTWRKAVVAHPSAARAGRAARTRVFAHWHGDEYTILHLVGRYHIATMTSGSADGRLVQRVIRLQGGSTCEGSSTRGGSGALRGLIRLCRRGGNASMALDGPRGPLHAVKPGVFMLARSTGGAIVPVGVAADRSHWFANTWNNARLPLPFARVVIYFGRILEPPTDAADDGYAVPVRQLGTAMREAEAVASQHLAGLRGVGSTV